MDANESFYNCTCPICGKKFHMKPFSLKRTKMPCCSKECSKKLRSKRMSGEGNHQYGLKGNKNATWESDRRISRYGYVQVRVLDHPFRDKADFVFEHRLVAEKHLLTDENSVVVDGKRYLSPKYDVHHINFDRKDNRVENLMVLTRSEHKKLHNALNPNDIDEKGHFKEKTDIIKYKKTKETAFVPTKATAGAAAFDLYADIDESITIQPFTTEVLQTNIAFDFPKGYYATVYARSGLSTKHGIRPATCVSVIDNDYHGSVGIPLHNDSDTPYTVNRGDRVSQIIFQKACNVEIVVVDHFDNETEREEKGFGSTGR